VVDDVFSIYYEHEYGRDEYIIHDTEGMLMFLKDHQIIKDAKRFNI